MEQTRTLLLKKKILEAPYEICIERARYYTQVFKETEQEDPSLRAAKALQKTLENYTIYILPEELLVGNRSSKLVGSVIPIERGEFNVVFELDLKNLKKRENRPFKITPEDERELMEEILPYWKKKTVRYYKEQEWKRNNLILKPRFGPFSIARRIKNFGIHRLWTTVKPLIQGRATHLVRGMREVAINNPNLVNNVFDDQGHLVLGINIVIKVGFRGIKEQALKLKVEAQNDHKKRNFYESVIISCDAIKLFADRFKSLAEKLAHEELNSKRKEDLLNIAQNMENVPWNPPKSFFEAVQFLWFTLDVANISFGVGGIFAVGRPDQYLYEYYKKDLESGVLTRSFAVELLEELLIKISYNLLILPSYAKQTASELGGDSSALTIGGLNEKGEDATNELSSLFMDATANIKNMTNSFSIRISSKSSNDFLLKIVDLYSKTSGPAIFNDEVIVPALLGLGNSLEEARNYAIIGCVEPASEGNTFSCTSGNDISLVGLLEMVLNNGKLRMMGKRTGLKTGKFKDFQSFDQVREAYKKQLAHIVEFIANCVNFKDKVYMERFHNPLVSLTLKGCLESGTDMTEGGAMYNFASISGRGLATTADSLLAIKKFVFEEKGVSPKQLSKILNKNFRSAKVLQQTLVHKISKYGNDDDKADEMANWVSDTFCDEVLKQKSIRGGYFRPGFFSYGMHIVDGSFLGATPNGRFAGEPVSNSLSPSNGCERNGITSVIKSYSKLPHKKISNGSSLNLKIHPLFLKSDENRKSLAAMIRSLIDLKGMHSQINVVDTETLKDAQIHPELYADLVVRVSGYCAYFTDLGKPVQDDIIQRTELCS